MATIQQFEKRIQQELGQYERLFYDLHDSQPYQRNWKRLNRNFSDRLAQKAEIAHAYEGLEADRKTAESYKKFVTAAAEHQKQILQRFIERSSDQYPIMIQTGKAPSSLPIRILKGLYNHSGKIAFIATALLLANRTQAGAQLLEKAGQMIVQACEPIQKAAVETVQNGLEFVTKHSDEIISALSGLWAIPAASQARRAGWTKTSGLILLAGASAAAAPHVLKPGFTLERAKQLGASMISTVSNWFNQRQPVRDGL